MATESESVDKKKNKIFEPNRGESDKDFRRRVIITRRREVEQYLSTQVNLTQVQRMVSEKYDVTARTIRNDINSCYAKWEKEAGDEKPNRRNQMRESLRAIVQKATHSKDWRAVIQALDRLIKLDGLDSPTVVQVNHKMIENMTSDDKRHRLLELFEKAEREAWRKGKLADVKNESNGKATSH